jgi:hypothetical protein
LIRRDNYVSSSSKEVSRTTVVANAGVAIVIQVVKVGAWIVILYTFFV